MLRLLSSFPNAFVMTGIALLCFPLFLFLIPPIEQGQTEARLAQTCNEVRRISLEIGKKGVPQTNDRAEISDTDLWGMPYQIRRIDDGQVRVISTGPNMLTTESGFDDDDVYSDMLSPPHRLIQTKNQQQRLLAFAAWGAVWLFFCVIYSRLRRADLD
jgi:hypothetical protein